LHTRTYSNRKPLRIIVSFLYIQINLKKLRIMKKKSIQKLSLNKNAVSTLTVNVLSGGTGNTQFYFSINFCETIDYTACNGEFICQIYTEPQR